MATRAATFSLDRYAPEARALVAEAQGLADQRGHVEVEPLHLLGRLLERGGRPADVLRGAGVEPAALARGVADRLARLPRGTEPSHLSARMLELLGRAEREADRARVPAVGVAELLHALSQEIRGPAGELLVGAGVEPGAFRAHAGLLGAPEPAPAGGTEAAPEARDLVRLARESEQDPVIGRDAELRRLLTILERREKHHPLLVGEPGVGKGAIVRGLAQRLAVGDVPTRLASLRLLEVDAVQLGGGARPRAEAEQRLRRLLTSLGPGADLLLVVRGLEALVGASGPSPAGEALSLALARGELRLLATTTVDGLRRLTERDPGLARRLTPLEVETPSAGQAIEVLRGLAQRLERHHGVRISEAAIASSVHLARRYLQDRFLPDAALDLLDESAAALRVESDGMPAEVDGPVRRVASLRAQLGALEGVDDAPTRATRERLLGELGELEPRVTSLRAALDSRRSAVAAARALADEAARAETALAEARARRDAARAGELEHVTLPDLARRRSAAEAAARSAGAPAEAAPLGEEQVAATLAAWTGIPVSRMLEGESQKLLTMEERLSRRVIGQEEGVRALARAVRRGRVGLRDPRRPIGSFLFLGPSGVGKTELAKALAELLFDDEAALTRLDMSEFMEKHMAQRLLGAPPGYADSEQGGFLTEAVRRRPYSVLLFDEVEKAHADVFNLLLQVLDDGRLTDGRGRLADFTNTVVILTSNIGSESILAAPPERFEDEAGRAALREGLLGELRRFFRPEFLNRLDDVIVFRPLAREHLSRIAARELARLGDLLAPRGVTLVVEPRAEARLVELGYEPALGARPLRRALVRHVQDPLAERLLDRSLEGGGTVVVREHGDGVVVEALVPAPVAAP